MCHKCLGRSTALLAALLACPVSIPDPDPSNAAKDQQANDDLKAMFDLLSPAMYANTDPDAKLIAEKLATIGLARIMNMFQLGDYYRDSLRHAIELAIAVIQSHAERGDMRAVVWMLQQADELKQYGVEVQTQIVAQMPQKARDDFMRPRGATPPHS